MKEMQGDELRKAFVHNVVTRRNEKGFRQSDVAEKAHISQAFVAQIEAGKRFPTPDILAALAEALETSPSALLSTEGIFSGNPD